jgi:ElaB/YqjD/DUF883 family membrane-anchored ribosome-binding protein
MTIVSKDPLDNVRDSIDKAGKDVRDAFREAGHRSAADAEKEKRELLGDELRPSEKAGSVVHESKERLQAELDEAKRKLRDHT